MHTLSIKNIHKVCRACLKLLEGGKSLETFPHLKNFCEFMIDQKAMQAISNSIILCGFCFKMLENLEADYKKFQNMVLTSEKRIQAILQTQNVESDEDDDNKLLLPELADWKMVGTEQETKEVKAEIISDLDDDDGNNSTYGDDDDEPLVVNESYDTTKMTPKTNGQEQLLIQQTMHNDLGSRKRDRRKKSFKCPSCNKQAYKKVYLDAHIRKIHEGLEKPFLCSVTECQKAFTRYNQLHVHIQTNHSIDAIKFTCDIEGCNESFRLGQTLESHRRIVHKLRKKFVSLEVEQNNQAYMKTGNVLQLENICDECGKKFHSKKSLSEHLRRHANDKRYVCEICHVSKVTKTELTTHKRIHDRSLEKFKCTLCPQEFNHKNAISRHVRVVHEGERRFCCRFCPRRFGTKNSQVCHERLHTGEKPFQCKICLKGFTQVEGLKSHMKNHNKNLRKHVCKFCSLRFITKKNLMDHEQRHLGSKPHICKICSRGFTRPEDLSLHLEDHQTGGSCSNDFSMGGSSDDNNYFNSHRTSQTHDMEDDSNTSSSSGGNSNDDPSEQFKSSGNNELNDDSSFFKAEPNVND